MKSKISSFVFSTDFMSNWTVVGRILFTFCQIKSFDFSWLALLRISIFLANLLQDCGDGDKDAEAEATDGGGRVGVAKRIDVFLKSDEQIDDVL